jgi:hypothetical protein
MHDIIKLNPSSQGQVFYWDNTSGEYLVGDHQSISGAGSNDHAAIDSHIADTTIHYAKSDISFGDLSDVDSAEPVGGEVVYYDSGQSIWSGLPANNNRDLLHYNASLNRPEWISRDSVNHSQLGALTNDDHTQYVLSAGTREMATLTVTGDTNLSGNLNVQPSGWDQLLGAGVPVVFHKNEGYPAASSNVSTALTQVTSIDLPSGILDNGHSYEVEILGRIYQQGSNVRMAIDLSGTTVLNSSISQATNSTYTRYKMTIKLCQLTSNTQLIMGHFHQGIAAGSTAGYGNWASIHREGVMHDEVSVDGSVVMALDLKVQHSGGGQNFTVDSVVGKLIPAAV